MASSDYGAPAIDSDEAPKRKNTPLSDVDFQSALHSEIQQATQFIDYEIAPSRQSATLYYRGALFGDEEEGRSKVVSRDVHDVVNAILPSLMRIFVGPENVVEFVATGPNQVDQAEQATEYVNYIVMRDNPGFRVMYDAFQDALIRKTGIVKFWWDDSVETTQQSYTGLTIDAVTKLVGDLKNAQDVEIVDADVDPEEGVSLTLKLSRKRDRARIAALAPEEFLIDRRARSEQKDEFTLIGHRRSMTVSELIAMGYKKEDIEDAVNTGTDVLEFNIERIARQPTLNTSSKAIAGDESQQSVLYIEAYFWCDRDGDGVSELWKACCIGQAHKVLHSEQVTDHPFAVFACDPEPHTFFGDSVAEKVMDIQKIKSGILRATLDSLALSIFPRTVVKKSGVEIEDVLNTEIGAVIRADSVDNVLQLDTPFVGQAAFPVLEYMDQVRESRTGMSMVSQGLDAEALQNTTAVAAAAQFTQAQQHIEIIARIFAETGMKRLFRGLLRLVSENQRSERVLMLGGKPVAFDPRSWALDMEVTTNVALGSGTYQEKIASLQMIAQKQEQIIALAGIENPLVGLPEYHNTLAKMLTYMGWKNPDTFIKDPSQQPQQAAQAQPPDPKMTEAQNNLQLGIAKLQLDAKKHMDDQQQKNADRQQALLLGLADLQAKYKTSIDTTTIKSEAEKLRAQADLVIKASQTAHAMKIDQIELGHKMRMDERQAEAPSDG